MFQHTRLVHMHALCVCIDVCKRACFCEHVYSALRYSTLLPPPLPLTGWIPQWDTSDAEIEISSAGGPELLWVLFLSFFFLPVGKNVALCASSVARNSSLLVSVFPIHSASWFFQIPFNYTACFPCGPTARSESPCSWSRFVKSDIASIISLRLIFFFSF